MNYGRTKNDSGMIRLRWLFLFFVVLSIVAFGVTYVIFSSDNKKLPSPFKIKMSGTNKVTMQSDKESSTSVTTVVMDKKTTSIPLNLIQKISETEAIEKTVVPLINISESGKIEIERLTTDVLQLTAIGAEGYVFTGWSTAPGVALSDRLSTRTTVTVPAVKNSVSVMAHFGKYYEVNTYEDLQKIKADPNGYYVMMSDIDASSSTVQRIVIDGVDYQGYSDTEEFVPVTRFSGCFDGNGKIIFGLSVKSASTSASATGFFGELAGTVKNLTLFDMESEGDTCVGGIAGIAGADAVIENCQVFGNVTGKSYVGMLVGKLSGDVNSCCVCGHVVGGTLAGGLVGENNCGKISNSYASCVVSGTNSIGGFVGANISSANDDLTTKSIVHCYSLSTVSGKKDVGAFVGALDENGTDCTESCYYDPEAACYPTADDGSTALSTADLLNKSSYKNWDFINVWGIVQGRSTPYLRRCFDGRFHIIGEKNGAGIVKTLNAELDSNRVPYFELTALPGEGSSFGGWSGWRTATAYNDTTVTMNNHRCIVADFVKVKEITTADDLLNLAYNGYDCCELMNDIDLTQYKQGTTEPLAIQPLPPFSGVFHGNGYTIRGLRINSSDENNVGLFSANNGEISELIIHDAVIRGKDNVGIIAGSNSGLISDCTVSGAIYGNIQASDGIAGINTGTLINNTDNATINPE